MSSSSSKTNDELLHLVQVKEIQGRGRSLVSSQPLKAGQIILKDSPILVYSAISLKNGDFSKFCSHCYRVLQQSPSSSSSSSSLSSCPSCSYHAIFCSSSCRTMALSSSHSPWVCQSLNSLRYSPRSLLSPDAQIQANFLIAAYNLAFVSPSSFQLLLSLQGESTTTPNANTLELHSLIVSLSPPQCSSLAGIFSPELTAALLAKDKQNAFGLMEPFQENGERTVRAYGIYPKVSFFNHDCLPNACRFDYVDAVGGDRNNTDIIIRAIHDVPQGREICLSYFPVNWNYADRQRRLMDDYGFTCDCDRCKVEVNWKDDVDEEEEGEEEMEDGDDVEMEGTDDAEEENSDFPHAYFFVRYVCDRDNCGGTLAPLPPSEGVPSNVMECNVCGRLRTEEDIDGDEDGIMLDE